MDGRKKIVEIFLRTFLPGLVVWMLVVVTEGLRGCEGIV